MDLDALKTEFAARGFDYLSDARQEYYLQRGYQFVCDSDNWPFLEATTTGDAPLTISDLRTVEAVTDADQSIKLVPIDPREVSDFDLLTTNGSPYLYWIGGGDTINVYPVATNSLSVRYYKIAPSLTAGTDSLIPSRFELVVVDAAVYYAYLDSDDFDAAQIVKGVRDEGIQQMREVLIDPQIDLPAQHIAQVATHLDA